MKKDNNSKQKKYNSLKIAIIILIAIIAFVIVVLCLKRCSKNNDNRIGFDTSQEESKDNTNQTYKRSVKMPGWISITIPANTIDINKGIDFYNPESNFWYTCKKCGYALDENYQCINEACRKQYKKSDNLQNDCYYMTFALYLKDTDELLYESKLVKPGKHISKITLSRPLGKGSYNAYVFIQPYKSDQATPCNNGKVDITLNVE